MVETVETDVGPLNKEQLLFMAKAAETAERYDDMTKFMRLLVTDVVKGDLSVEERNLLSVAYKNVIGARRASWRTLNVEENKTNQLISTYRKQVETELANICREVLDVLTNFLIPAAQKANNVESQVFYLKMTGDYYRYFAEFQPDQQHADKAKENYEKAFELATNPTDPLPPTHPIRLGLALNFSVCYFEILQQPDKACELAKNAFDDAIAKLDTLDEASYKDSTLIMQLLRDNLTLWTQDTQESQDD
uniref:14-3-3 domain-containing protein n=1 Tax=Spongospora subterranea TaxID=70186 RepID=A0A0H5R529_9EUKA|eukprot:CRZ08902.1 hypothetical protein [Spongospora subterranea]